MRTCFVCCAFLLLFTSCSSKNDGLAGHWLLLYPDHKLASARQREIYGRHQDSLVSLYGLKLLTLTEDGAFGEADSLQKPSGHWLLTNDKALKIREGGKGFNPFNTTFKSLKNGELQLAQQLPMEGEAINVVWHLKKIEDGDEAAVLFSDSANAWRKVPTAPETSEARRRRLATMLAYYGRYFKLIGREASYFLPTRLPLPFRYYQHAVGLQAGQPPAFRRLFYSDAEAALAYGLLEHGIAALQGQYPTGDNFVLEYGAVFEKLAAWLRKDVR